MDAAPAPLPARVAAKPLLRVLAGERVEPPPLWLMRQAGRYLPEYRALRGRAGSFLECCNTPALAAEITLQPVHRFGFDAAIVFSDILVVPHAMGRALRFADGEGPLLAPLEGAHAVAALEPLRAVEGNPALLETLALLRQRLAGATALIGFAGAPFTLAAYMIDGESGGGFAATRALMAADPALLDRLVETLAHAVAALLCAQIEAGAEAVQLFESWGSLIAGDEAFERWGVAPARRIVATLHERHPGVPVIGFPRGTGRARAYARATGVDALQVDQDTGLETMQALQRLLPVQGNLDPAVLLRGGPPLRRSVAALLAGLAAGPHVVNLGHGIDRRTPLAHVEALVAAVRGPGRRPS